VLSELVNNPPLLGRPDAFRTAVEVLSVLVDRADHAMSEGNPRRIGHCPKRQARDGGGCTRRPLGGVHPERLKAKRLLVLQVTRAESRCAR
jgi:hypothetical protein